MLEHDPVRLAVIQAAADSAQAEMDAARMSRDTASQRLADAQTHHQRIARDLEPRQPAKRHWGISEAEREAEAAAAQARDKAKAEAEDKLAMLQQQVQAATERLQAVADRVMPAIELNRRCQQYARGDLRG